MKTGIRILTLLMITIVIAGCSPYGVQSADLLPTGTPLPTMPASCSDPVAIVKALYTAVNAGQYDASLAFFANDATLSSWAEGINGHHMTEKNYSGIEQLRTALTNPGLRLNSGQPDTPIYHEDKYKAAGNKVTLMLIPDRVHPDGRPFNPYTITVIFDGCKIKAMTVVEQVTWL
jgi:hypothetical protein